MSFVTVKSGMQCYFVAFNLCDLNTLVFFGGEGSCFNETDPLMMYRCVILLIDKSLNYQGVPPFKFHLVDLDSTSN